MVTSIIQVIVSKWKKCKIRRERKQGKEKKNFEIL